MKNRLLLCLLICGVLLYYGLPRLSINAGGLEGIFSAAWILFALMVIGGNLAGLLYSPKKNKAKSYKVNKMTQNRRRLRQYQ
ncbi:hypothetical protein IM538_18760 [Cytobacillus suaedae]|nr:hypothetical protein IM538_18760 [Cytobacillus suaedae]